ncbi:MAG: response regulator [Chloroflexota bacterium]|nr:response regulator [Chloroflexota bacterium]
MNKTILVVDDEITISKMLSLLLRKHGYDVIATIDPLKADSILDVVTPALIILDYMMPEMSGIELCRQLRRRTDTRDTTIFMLSALNDLAIIRESRDVGIDAYFSKDEMTGRLLEAIEQHTRFTQKA